MKTGEEQQIDAKGILFGTGPAQQAGRSRHVFCRNVQCL